MSGAIPYMYQYPPHVFQGYTRYNVFNPLNLFNQSCVEHEKGQWAVPCCSVSQKRYFCLSARAYPMHCKNIHDLMIALLCKPRENESRRQIVTLKSLGTTVASITDVVLSRARLQFLDELCKELGLSNEPVIFQTEADVKAKKNSVLEKGQHLAEVALWWILGEMLFHFLNWPLLYC